MTNKKTFVSDAQQNPELFNNIKDYSDTRWRQLQELIIGYAKEGIKLLLIINSGAAIALLTFMGTKLIDYKLLVCPLLLYFLGIVALGISILYLVANYMNAMFGWSKDMSKFWKGHISFEELEERDVQRLWNEWIPYGSAVVSFGFFIWASIMVYWAFQA